MFRSKKFTPLELFDLVWATPVSTVARQIGISDVGLSKACRKAGILLPARGHWTKAERRRPKKPKPPTSTDAIEFRVRESQGTDDVPSPCPTPTPLQIVVPQTLSNPHPLVQRWMAAVRKAKDVEGHVLLPGTVLNSKVSKSAADRCALLYDTLIKEGEALGFAWKVDDQGTKVTVAGETLKVSIEEHVSRVEVPRPPRRALKPGEAWTPNFTALQAPRYSWKATGELSLHIGVNTEGREQKNWKDTAKLRLELKLGQILTALPALAAAAKVYREKCEARELQWRHEDQLRQERLAWSARTRKLRSNLVANTVNWEKAQRLRAFIQATIDAAPHDEQTQQELALWAAWAKRQVAILDPLGGSGERTWRMSADIDPPGYHGPMYRTPKDPNSWWE